MEFRNINIVGNGGDLDSTKELYFANVSLVGDYRTGERSMTGHFYGNLDIEGDFPPRLTNNTHYPSGYLTAWKASGHAGMNNFVVFHVKTTDGNEIKNMGASNSLYMTIIPLQAVVFEKRMAIYDLATSTGSFSTDALVPRAYRVVRGTKSGEPEYGQYRFTGSTSDGFAPNGASDTTKPVPSIDPEEWRAAGNLKTNPATTTWGALDSSKKWSSSAFSLISMLRDRGVRLADVVLSRLSGRQMG
jgi:hypothetical protein